MSDKPRTTRVHAATQARTVANVSMVVNRVIERGSTVKTFGISSSRDMLGKLDRELKRVQDAVKDSPVDVADHCYNFAVTAWHIVDWVFAENGGGTDEERKAFAIKVQGECADLVPMRVIATYSKHAECKRDDASFGNPRVSGVATYAIDPAWPDGVPPNATVLSGVEVFFRPKADFSGDARQMVDVFENVLVFWRKRLGVPKAGTLL
jgi:hypothetical protein